MKNIQRVVIVFLLFFSSMMTSKAMNIQIDDIPECIRDKISENLYWLIEVRQWEVDSQFFYLFTYDCIDCFVELYDENCEYICAPYGGITGGGDFNCPDWNGTPIDTLIWKSSVWPGDFNNNGIVDNYDILYWVSANGFTGPTRPNASISWSAQDCPSWSSSANHINSKHQDGNGDGIVDVNDLTILILNYGKTQDYYVPTSHISGPERYKLELISSTKSDGIITNTYELYVETSGVAPVSAYGLSCSIYFDGLPLINARMDVSNSSLMPTQYFDVFDAIQNRLDIVLTRTDNNNQTLNDPVASIVVDMENIQGGNPFKILVRNGSTISAGGYARTISDGTTYGFHSIGVGGISADNFHVGVSVNHEGCVTLGSATVQTLGGTPPFTYIWSTGDTTNIISDLISGAYSVTVSDSTGLSITIPFIVYGQVPVYGSPGEVICEGSICPDYLMKSGYIPPDVSYHADVMIDSDGIILDGIDVQFKAGETIKLDKGFTVQQGANFLGEIEDCN